jgi:hypothetical protein
MATNNIVNYGFKSVPRNIIYTDNTTGIIHVTPSASKFVLATGLTEIKKQAASQLGVKVTATTVIDAEEPLMTLSYGTLNAFTAGLLFGRSFAVQTLASYLAKNNVLLSGNSIAGATSAGQEGYGLAADPAGAIASQFNNNLDVPLTYVTPYSTFDPVGTTNSFAVGANGALKFSNNLIGYPVSWLIPVPTASRLALTGNTFFDFNVKVFFLDLQNRVSLFEATSVKPVLGKNFDPSAESVDIELRVNYDGSTCAPYSFQYIGTDQAFC